LFKNKLKDKSSAFGGQRDYSATNVFCFKLHPDSFWL